MTSWVPEAAENFQALAAMIEAGEVAFSEVPDVMVHNLYLVSSFLYYELADQILTDQTYDLLCRYLLENYERLSKIVWWPEKTLDPNLLVAGSGFAIPYPKQVEDIAMKIYRRKQ